MSKALDMYVCLYAYKDLVAHFDLLAPPPVQMLGIVSVVEPWKSKSSSFTSRYADMT